MHRLPRHNIIRVFEGFAGYGGATFGLRRSGVRHRIVGYSEVDEDAIEMYHYNFPNVRNLGDITKLDPNNNRQCPDFDLFTGGFPCQPFSTVGKRQGQEDERGRGTFFGDIIRICEVKQPQYILLENAKGLTGAEAAKELDYYGVLEYLEEHFEVLHTQSHQWILEDIDEFINIREKEGYQLWKK